MLGDDHRNWLAPPGKFNDTAIIRTVDEGGQPVFRFCNRELFLHNNLLYVT